MVRYLDWGWGGMSDSGNESGREEELAARHEASMYATEVWDKYSKLGDRLDELAHEYGDEDAKEAFRTVEDLVTDLDDALAEAQEAIDLE